MEESIKYLTDLKNVYPSEIDIINKIICAVRCEEKIIPRLVAQVLRARSRSCRSFKFSCPKKKDVTRFIGDSTEFRTVWGSRVIFLFGERTSGKTLLVRDCARGEGLDVAIAFGGGAPISSGCARLHPITQALSDICGRGIIILDAARLVEDVVTRLFDDIWLDPAVPIGIPLSNVSFVIETRPSLGIPLIYPVHGNAVFTSITTVHADLAKIAISIATQHGYDLSINVAKKLVEKSVKNECGIRTSRGVTNYTLACIRACTDPTGLIDESCIDATLDIRPIEDLIPHGIYV